LFKQISKYNQMKQSTVNKPASRKGKEYIVVAHQTMNPPSASTGNQDVNWLSTNEVTAAFNNAV